jgi:uncharacterized protein
MATRVRSRRVLRTGVAICAPVLAAAALAALGWRASTSAMHPAPAQVQWTLRDFPALGTPRALTVRSSTGVELRGRVFPGRNGATVVLTHGYGGTQDEMLPVADVLHRHGLGVATYDSRGTGTSGGAVTFGALERRDLHSVVDAVSARPDVDPRRIGALGFSMGAATTILEAAGDPRVRAVVDDSGWSDVRNWLRPRALDAVLHPRRPFSPVALRLAEWRSGARFMRLRPADVAGRLSPRPLLVIHGANDAVVPPRDGDEIFAAAGPPKAIVRVPAAGHGGTLAPGGATASGRVARFFVEALER